MSWSLACNGNSAICCGFSTLTNRLQPQLAPARTLDKAYALWVLRFHDNSNKKGLSEVVLFYYWRRWESNPRPKWIKINLYECRYLSAQLIPGSIKTVELALGFIWQGNSKPLKVILIHLPSVSVLRLASLTYKTGKLGSISSYSSKD